MAKEPRPGMGQDEKDKLGQAAHDALQKDLALEAAARTVGGWRPDEELADLSGEDLAAEAAARGVTLPKSIAAAEAAKRLTARRKEVEDWQRRRDEASATPPTGA
jgi:hypothetical protein